MKIIRSGGESERAKTQQLVVPLKGVLLNAELDPKRRSGPSVFYDPLILTAMESNLFSGETGQLLGRVAAFFEEELIARAEWPNEAI